MKLLIDILIGALLLMWDALSNAVSADDLGLDDECLRCDMWGRCYTNENGEEKAICSICPKFRENFPSPFSSQK